jgi:hypothetical protein
MGEQRGRPSNDLQRLHARLNEPGKDPVVPMPGPSIHTETVRFGWRRLRNIDTRPETARPNVAAGDAGIFSANSFLWSDLRRKRRSEIASAVNHGIGFADEAYLYLDGNQQVQRNWSQPHDRQ